MRIVLVAFFLTAAILFTPAARAVAEIGDEDLRWGCTPMHKLERGLVNICTFPLELPASMISVADEKGEIFGFIIGAVEGLAASVFRAVSGAYDTLTFFIPSYSKPIMEPEYALQSLEKALN
jgi:putative exosortase-associated protein (TIGR04073 family)